MLTSRVASVLAAVAATLVVAGCGGASTDDENYPVLFSLYGGYDPGGFPSPARFGQTFTWTTGETWDNDCIGYIRVLSQEGANWTGKAERGVWNSGVTERCHTSGEMAGEVGMDGSIRFTLTQDRWLAVDFPDTVQWIECTATAPGRYTGQLDRNRFYAQGTTPVVCDDGREGTVQESMSGTHPAPSGTHDT